jgi:chemotaxis protein MotB
VNELVELLGLETERSEALRTEVEELSGLVSTLSGEKEALRSQVADLSRQSALDQETLKSKLLLIASLQEDIDALQRVRRELEARVGTIAASLRSKETEIGVLRDRSKALDARLLDEQERTQLAQKEIEQRDIRIQALSALVGQQEQALEEERRLSADMRAEVALLSQQITNLRRQLEEISRALDVAEAEKSAQEAKIKELGKRLNIALARRVNELERYRSEFFGRLREILGDNPYVRIEGDRFVLQSELLFASGSASLGEEGRRHLAKLAAFLKELSKDIPKDIEWILRIDGHTDRVPIHNERFASNWELSTSRALSVVQFLASQGISESRMAAAGFSQFHPIDAADTPEAYRKNRRIEIKLTSR